MTSAFGILGMLDSEGVERRIADMLRSLLDFEFTPDLEEPDWEGDDTWVEVRFTGQFGYDFSIQARKIETFWVSGFALTQAAYRGHSPVIRVIRAHHPSHWMGSHLNMRSDTPELRLLAKNHGFRETKYRLKFTDQAANTLFGDCCHLFLNGTLL